MLSEIRTQSRPLRRIGAPFALVALLAGCGTGGASSAPSSAASTGTSTAPSAAVSTGSSSAPSAATSSEAGGSVTAALSEFKIELGATNGTAGPVTFEVTNKGTTAHEFVVFQTDLAADKLPLSEGGTEVDEEGEGVTVIDEVDKIAVGSTETLAVTLPAGHYVVICNLPAHYPSGMRAEFTTS